MISHSQELAEIIVGTMAKLDAAASLFWFSLVAAHSGLLRTPVLRLSTVFSSVDAFAASN